MRSGIRLVDKKAIAFTGLAARLPPTALALCVQRRPFSSVGVWGGRPICALAATAHPAPVERLFGKLCGRELAGGLPALR